MAFNAVIGMFPILALLSLVGVFVVLWQDFPPLALAYLGLFPLAWLLDWFA